MNRTTLFWAKVEKTSGCWLWIGARNVDGYGVLMRFGRMKSSHRTSWEIAHGPIPDGLHVLHRCDVRNCVRPSHLWLGTKQDNCDDKMAKGRHLVGELAASAKLTAAQVREIRSLKGKMTQKEIAEKYGVCSGSYVGHIQNRRAWKYLA